MYRCTAQQWQEWGWGSTGDGLQYTALLRDSAADQPSQSAAEAGQDGDDDGDDDDDVISTTADRQQNGRGRRKTCRQG